ncbi:MAG TPA: HdeD family acid-resistance protein [Hymenobacter sp.]|jgi:uncharacterized membrane protein HdeD (DUF308 family)|uniref:HdeD family acid-resistance protein n=1 Tax=Hymenobacter sp. TaxID=1898978 RepID=UPI002EDA7CD8
MMIPSVLHTNWWLLALRGLAAAVFGLLTFLQPGLTLFVLVTLFGFYCIINGILTLISAFRRGRQQPRWWAMALEGVASIIAGAVAFFWPGISLLSLLLIVAIWAIVTGILQIATAIRLRKQIQREWVLLLGGLLSIAFGAVVVFWPDAGALAVSWWIGSYVFTIGIVLGVLAFRLRRHSAGRGNQFTGASMSSAAG